MTQTGVKGMPVYESRPPAWLPKAHEFADLGEYDHLYHGIALNTLRRLCWIPSASASR